MFENDIRNLEIIAVLDISRSPTDDIAKPREFHALSFRLKGDCVFSYGREKTAVGDGEIVFVPEGLGYGQKSNVERLFCVHFTAEGLDNSKIIKFTPKNPASFELLFSSMCKRWLEKKAGYRSAALSDLYAIISKIQSEQSISSKAPGYKEEIYDYIHTHYRESELSVSSIAEHFHLSESYFRKLFVQSFGISPLKYINLLRVDYAADLISSGYYRINEAAEMSGFRDAKYFSTAVKEITGKRPSDFKK